VLSFGIVVQPQFASEGVEEPVAGAEVAGAAKPAGVGPRGV